MDEYLKEIVHNGLKASFWREYLVPAIKDDIERYKLKLTYCSMEEVIKLQTRVMVLEELLKKPHEDQKAKGG